MAMHYIPALVSIAILSVVAWHIGWRWSQLCGIRERSSAFALGGILPTSILVLSVHLMAYATLVAGSGLVTPNSVAAVYIFLTLISGTYVSRLSRNGSHHLLEKSPPARRLDLGWCWIPVVVVGMMYLVFLIDALSRYPTGYDGLHYHLPIAFEWARAKELTLIEGVITQTNPDNGMFIPFLLAFVPTERLLTILFVPTTIHLMFVCFGLARSLGLSTRACVVAICITLSVPIIVFQTFSSYIDLYAADAWMSALLGIVWITRAKDGRQRSSLAILAGLAAGVALGSKAIYLVLMPILAGVAYLAERMRSRSTRQVGQPIRMALIVLGVALATSSFWFARGAVETGNPLYPIDLKIGDTQILSGIDTKQFFVERSFSTRFARWIDYPWREPKHSGLGYPYSVNNALGAPFTTFVPVGIFLVVIGWLRKVNPDDPGRRWQHIFVGLGALGCLLLLTIFQETLRFVLPLVLVSAILGAMAFSEIHRRAPRFAAWLLTASVSVTAIIATLPPIHAMASRARSNTWDRNSFYEIPDIVEQLPNDARILNLASNGLTYPLLGRKLRNSVIASYTWVIHQGYEPVSEHSLRENEIDYVFMQSGSSLQLAKDLPVECVYDNSQSANRGTSLATQVYRVRSASEKAIDYSGKAKQVAKSPPSTFGSL